MQMNFVKEEISSNPELVVFYSLLMQIRKVENSVDLHFREMIGFWLTIPLLFGFLVQGLGLVPSVECQDRVSSFHFLLQLCEERRIQLVAIFLFSFLFFFP